MKLPRFLRTLLMSKPDPKAQPVRRHKNNNGWCIADKDRYTWEGSLQNGLLTGVTFIHHAMPMTCYSGYESTGEAVGVITDGITELPKEAVRQTPVVYNRHGRKFHEKDNPVNVIDAADFLLLLEDGSAIAAWKN